MSKRIPVTVLTGFLGAGKTTILRHLLINSDLKLAVMINEFGSIGLDGDLIKTCGFCDEESSDSRLIELNNGCLCCTVQDDFLPSIQTLISGAKTLDGIVIETSGLALPRPLIQALEWPEIKSKVFLNAVVTVVDTQALSLGSPIGDLYALEKQRNEDESLDHLTPIDELFQNQLNAADLVLMSRSDLISKECLAIQIKNLEERIHKGVNLLPISHGILDPSLILDSNRFESKNNCSILSLEEDHNHVDVFSESIRLEKNIDKVQLEKLLMHLADTFKLLRVKGRLWQLDRNLPLQVQMVGTRLSTWFEKAPKDVWSPKEGGLDLILIGLKKGASKAISEAFS